MATLIGSNVLVILCSTPEGIGAARTGSAGGGRRPLPVVLNARRHRSGENAAPEKPSIFHYL